MSKRFVDSEGSVVGAVLDAHVAAMRNQAYRRVLFTGYAQVVLYSLEPNETLPLESHCEVAQLLNVVAGNGRVFIGEDNSSIKTHDTVVITPGTPHRVVNTSESGAPLKMWSVYTAPQFFEDRVDERQPTRAGNPATQLSIQFKIPRLLPRRKKKEPKGTVENVDTWASMRPQMSTRGVPTVLVSMVKEHPRKHPWNGYDKRNKKKYALAGVNPFPIEGIPHESMKKPAQGVHLVLEAGGPYIFNTKKVLGEYPFYFTKSIEGGKGFATRDNLALSSIPDEATNRGKARLSLTAPITPGLWVAYYQCTKFNNMGGPVSVHPPGQPPVFTAGDSMVLRDTTSGTFSVMIRGRDSIHTGLDFDTALATVGACIRTQFVFTVDGKVDCGTIVPQEDCNTTMEECPHHDDEPAVLFHGGSDTRYCDHIHPLGELRQWLQSNDTVALCPTCEQ